MPTEMIIHRAPLLGKEQTAASMYRMVDLYADDLQGAARRPLRSFHRRVAQMPYRRDPAGVEVVARPKWGAWLAARRGIDCKKKAVIMAAWLKLHHIPFRFIGSSSQKVLFGKPKIHHVFPQGYFCNPSGGCRWRSVD